MNLQTLTEFAETRIESLPTKFTFLGVPISASDIAAPEGMLPLIVLTINKLHESVTGIKTKNSSLVEAAPASTHILSCAAIELPNVSDGLMSLLMNSAILEIARAPSPPLDLPRDLSEESLPKTSELSFHIENYKELEISPLATAKPELDRPQETPSI